MSAPLRSPFVWSVRGVPVVPQVGPSKPRTVHCQNAFLSGSDPPSRSRDMAESVRTAGANSTMLDVPAGLVSAVGRHMRGLGLPIPISFSTAVERDPVRPVRFLQPSSAVPAGFQLSAPDLRAPIYRPVFFPVGPGLSLAIRTLSGCPVAVSACLEL